MNKKLKFVDLELRRAILEIRYNEAYILWDRSGQIWSEVKSIWPEMKNQKTEPSYTSFLLDDKRQFWVQLDKSNYTDFKPQGNLNDFITNVAKLISLVSDVLKISEYTRLGFRLLYSKYLNTKEEASEYLLSTENIKYPSGKHFNIEGKVLNPSCSMKWEGESTGVRVVLTTHDKKIDLEVNPDVDEINPVHIERSELLYDIDYYTVKNTKRGQLKIDEWISQAYHLIKRDSKIFFGED